MFKISKTEIRFQALEINCSICFFIILLLRTIVHHAILVFHGLVAGEVWGLWTQTQSKG